MAIQYNSNFDLTIPFSDVCAQVALQANTAETYTVPGLVTDQYSARFTYAANSNVFVRYTSSDKTPVAATVPAAGTVEEEQYNEFRPGDDGSQRYVNGGDVISLITPDATAYVGISIRQLP